MTNQVEPINTPTPPETIIDSIEDNSGLCVGVSPIYQAAATVQHWLKPIDENHKLEYLAVAMESVLIF